MPIEVNVFQTFNYIGSKTKLLNYIGESITEYTKKDLKNIDSFLDAFSGTGVVSYYMLKNGCKNVISNDIQHYAYTISSVWSDIDVDILKINKILLDINNMLVKIIKPIKSDKNYIHNTYTPASKPERMYFTELNGYKIDITRMYIEKIAKDISYNEYKLLLKILLYSASNVANISSTYGAFLKKFKPNALKELVLKDNILETLVKSKSNTRHKTYNKDIFELLNEIKTKEIEVCYLDSPYNSRNYSKNYFVLEAISKYDKSTVRGITGLRDQEIEGSKTFCSKVNTKNEFKKLFEQIKCKYLFMSYSSDSIVSKTDIISLLSENWKDIVCKEQDYKKFKSNKNTDDKQVIEYLFCATRIN